MPGLLTSGGATPNSPKKRSAETKDTGDCPKRRRLSLPRPPGFVNPVFVNFIDDEFRRLQKFQKKLRETPFILRLELDYSGYDSDSSLTVEPSTFPISPKVSQPSSVNCIDKLSQTTNSTGSCAESSKSSSEYSGPDTSLTLQPNTSSVGPEVSESNTENNCIQIIPAGIASSVCEESLLCTSDKPPTPLEVIVEIKPDASLTKPLGPTNQNIINKGPRKKIPVKHPVWGSRRSIRVLKGNRKKMLNGYGNGDGRKSSTDESPSDPNSYPPIATLGNLGNTCFLNSVLYTLRFTPSFVHNIHHLASELSEISSKQHQVKSKTSSLGRNVASGKTWSSTKEMLCISPANLDQNKSKLQVTTEKLHCLFEALHASEMKESCDPFQADDYLKSLREVNPYFDGNQQHDAHELLVCLLNNVHETCVQLAKSKGKLHLEEMGNGPRELDVHPSPVVPMTNSKSWGVVRKSWKRSKKDKHVNTVTELVDSKPTEGILPSDLKTAESQNTEAMNGIILQMPLVTIEEDSQASIASQESTSVPKEGDTLVDSFVVNDFQGVTILNTTCLECERTSLRKEVFSDIGVCVTMERKDEDNMSDDSYSSKSMSEVYESAIVTTEYLRDLNKYWCETCTRYNEAKRSVQYETLPKLLTLQLKRFASNINSMTKISDHMPTPLTLACFCTRCCVLPEDKRLHKYQLYGVIMHLGQAIASGHYVAYVRASDNVSTYINCQKDKNKSSSLSAGSAKSGNCDKMGSFLRFFKHTKSNPESTTKSSSNSCPQSHSYTDSCRGLDCCGVRLNQSFLNQLQNGSLVNKRKDKESQVIRGDEADTSVPEPIWLECDDDNVRPLTVREFQELLGPKSSMNSGQTPYLLFYSRCP